MITLSNPDGPTLASQSEFLSDFDDVHCNSTDANSSFYFRTIAETDIKPTEFKSIQGNWVRQDTSQITETII